MKILGLFLISPIWQIISGLLISGGISYFGPSMLLSFCLVMGLFAAYEIVVSRWVEAGSLNQLVKEYRDAFELYRKKPYRQYLVDFNCAHCGHKNEVDFDLAETEFVCSTCKKNNAIHINFMTAAIDTTV